MNRVTKNNKVVNNNTSDGSSQTTAAEDVAGYFPWADLQESYIATTAHHVKRARWIRAKATIESSQELKKLYLSALYRTKVRRPTYGTRHVRMQPTSNASHRQLPEGTNSMAQRIARPPMNSESSAVGRLERYASFWKRSWGRLPTAAKARSSNACILFSCSCTGKTNPGYCDRLLAGSQRNEFVAGGATHLLN